MGQEVRVEKKGVSEKLNWSTRLYNEKLKREIRDKEEVLRA